MIVFNATKDVVLSDRSYFASSFWQRLIGLLNRKTMTEGDGLLLDRCYGIHTFGMRFSIDVICLDANRHVSRVIREFPPLRVCVLKKAMFIIELPAGTLDRTRTTKGDKIQIRDSSLTSPDSTKNKEAYSLGANEIENLSRG